MKKFEYSDKIVIKDFEVKACHGVNQDEKINPQRFLISATVIEDMSEAAKLDDLAKTASYSAVKKVIDAYVKNNCFDLIETLGVRLAELILKKFDNLYSAEVTVKKPDAPMSGVFDYVAVNVLR
ncbi:MAG: dihydroneopterin aldolase, partial [Clostridia bacterium]